LYEETACKRDAAPQSGGWLLIISVHPCNNGCNVAPTKHSYWLQANRDFIPSWQFYNYLYPHVNLFITHVRKYCVYVRLVYFKYYDLFNIYLMFSLSLSLIYYLIYADWHNQKDLYWKNILS